MRAGVVLLSAGIACSYPTRPPLQSLICTSTSSRLVVDGAPADSAWRSTPHTRLLPLEGVTTAEAKCLHTDQGLAIFVAGPDTHLTARVTDHDGPTWNDDVFEVFLQPGVGEHYYEFHITPAGTTLDMRLPAPEGEDPRTSNNPVFHQLSAAILDGTLNDQTPDTGWSAEFLIPWTDIGGAPTPGAQWTGHVARYDYAADGTYALASTAPLSEPSFHRRHEWPALVF